jgi:hypothetical protein
MNLKYEVENFIDQIEAVLKEAKKLQGIIAELEEENKELKSQNQK